MSARAPKHPPVADKADPAKRREVVRGGRVWTIQKVRWEDAEETDFRFWHEGLSPEERVDAVQDALDTCLATRGDDAQPRLRRVHRRVKRS